MYFLYSLPVKPKFTSLSLHAPPPPPLSHPIWQLLRGPWENIALLGTVSSQGAFSACPQCHHYLCWTLELAPDAAKWSVALPLTTSVGGVGLRGSLWHATEAMADWAEQSGVLIS